MDLDIDLTTLLVACALALATVTTVFTITAALRHNDESNRTWVGAFAAALCATGLTAIYGLDRSTPAAVVATIDASWVFATGALWAGCRLLDGRRRSLILVVLLVGLAAAAPAALGGPDPDLDVVSIVRLGLSGFFAWLAATELMRGPMRLNLNARILQTTLLVVGGWFIAAAALFAAGEDGGRPGQASTILPFTAIFVVAAICLSALRVERSGNWWSVSVESRRQSDLPVLAAESFREDARDRVERAALTGGQVGLVLAEISDLDELNSAFGRDAGDRALIHFTQVLRSHVPASALIGYLGAGRFAVLVDSAMSGATALVVSAVRTGLVEESLGERLEIRTGARFGTSGGIQVAPTFEGLLADATADLDRVRVLDG
ncbi:diguanylate cyclase [Aeromicrobium sp. S22]|uniref:diguanylate cyclase domain-containing protein n=1 Tax=Aeromicrobium sp. S22 TaxID=2662029 RepID=UPI00129EABB6|nr:diguanylate cyclase [Aeromicrobium sp. S22]MRK00812.1 diguanylate cyclase [Aeromicrobium sp. S22]